MKILDLLKDVSIDVNATCSNKDEAIDTLVSLMAKQGNLNDQDVYKQGIYAREELSTTGIGEGIAIPHAQSEVVNAPGLAAMVVKDGVDYQSLDNQPAKLFFMIAVPKTGGNEHLQILAMLSQMLMDTDFKDSLINAQSVEEFMDLINQKEAAQKAKEEEKEEAQKEFTGTYRLLAVTACPTGIAHTYMAAEALEEKAKQGVDVRLIYDDVGCIVTLPHNYKNTLEAKGIKCRVFNPIKPFFTRRLNNRDHRKIVVIDGDVGFTGGINLADEYINEYEKHGYWKDAGIMLKGDAVWNLTVMFLSMWDYIDNKEEDYIKFKPSKNKYYNSKGYVQPFDDSPLINEPIGETVYLNLINKAKDYIYINTPYLIIDNEMATALKIAAKSGVDIKIVTPYIPDKKFVHAVTKSYYESFIKDGIEIYEFTPGFMHAKTFVVDDEYGVVGSINLDFRSLYLHYECGVWLYKTESIKSMKDDYLETLKRCHKVTMEECKNTSSIRKVLRLIIRMFAPLL